ncbi:MAG: hypothetical protein KAH56_05260 [Candidatus Krumholzibacteria bacterium]|nr:hypothetical protein [Candidatus Krumholzibacteria bacterium]
MIIVLFPMRDRRDPWKWPVCVGVTVAMVLATMFLLPQSWIDAFFSPLSLVERLEREQHPEWMVILPPPPVEMVPDHHTESSPPKPDPTSPEHHRDPDWWSRGWRVMTTTDSPAVRSQAPADSVAILLTALGVERDFMTLVRPDSVMASRLFLMQVEDAFKFDELKPYLEAMARSRDYADIMSRAADMYDDFLATEIMTPD